MRLALVTAPTQEPLTVSEMQEHSRIDINDDDALLSSYIQAARLWCETATGRAFISQTWDMYLDGFPGGVLYFPKAPLLSVTSVTAYDTADAATVVSATNYQVTTGTPGTLRLKAAGTWPSVSLRAADGVVIRFVAGYGTTANAVPENIRAALRLLTAHLYEHREPVLVGTTGGKLPFTVEALLSPDYYRTPRPL
jgi:uncharacterized phiE125 gp8 family phage protein